MTLFPIEFKFDALTMAELRNLQDLGYRLTGVVVAHPNGDTRTVNAPEAPAELQPGDVVKHSGMIWSEFHR